MTFLQTSFLNIALLIFAIYLFPIFTFRFLEFFFPVRFGLYKVGQKKIEGWILLLKIQMLFTIFPQLERSLHLIPGLFSWWLRLWGSKIGKGVIWTPQVEITDRSLLSIGHGTLIGHRSILCSHVVSIINGKHFVYCKKITIGDYCLIGGLSVIGPGVVIEDNVKINVASELYPNTLIKKGTIYDRRNPSQ